MEPRWFFQLQGSSYLFYEVLHQGKPETFFCINLIFLSVPGKSGAVVLHLQANCAGLLQAVYTEPYWLPLRGLGIFGAVGKQLCEYEPNRNKGIRTQYHMFTYINVRVNFSCAGGAFKGMQ